MTNSVGPDRFLRDAGVTVPVIKGPMFPCSNPELILAVASAGGLATIQPASMEFVHGYGLAEGIDWLRARTDAPLAVNLLLESSAASHRERLERWLHLSCESGVRFFITSLGNPRWVVDQVAPYGAAVYHDVTDSHWARKAVRAGVSGLIAVNRLAGGHPGAMAPRDLLAALRPMGLPVIQAGGVASNMAFRRALDMGYAGAQCGTRFVATTECTASDRYKAALLRSTSSDLLLTRQMSGIPASVLRTPFTDAASRRIGHVLSRLLRNPRTKHLARRWLSWRANRELPEGMRGRIDYWQAGHSVDQIRTVVSARQIVGGFRREYRAWTRTARDHERRLATQERASPS